MGSSQSTTMFFVPIEKNQIQLMPLIICKRQLAQRYEILISNNIHQIFQGKFCSLFHRSKYHEIKLTYYINAKEIMSTYFTNNQMGDPIPNSILRKNSYNLHSQTDNKYISLKKTEKVFKSTYTYPVTLPY